MLIELSIIYILCAVSICISLYLWYKVGELTEGSSHNAWTVEYRLNNLLKRIEKLEAAQKIEE